MEERSATHLFAEYLDAKERGEDPDFEALCVAHPEFAATLRERLAEQGRMEAVLAREKPSRSAASGDPSLWQEYLEKLSKLGPPATRYVRGAELNSGGMGEIHRVADPLLERRLVVKRMHDDANLASASRGPTPRSDDKSLGRFLEEAKITARLDHPYIVPVHDIGLDASGRVYFAMKHVRGEDLRRIFDRIHAGDSEWSITRGVQVMLKICEAMAYAHVKGVIHRDLKPGNVMVGKFGEVYVMDWGLARILGEHDTKDLRIREDTSASAMQSERRAKHAATGATPDSPLITMDGDVMGTPAYMPLEQAEGNISAIGPRADIYAVGAMLYHLLAGTMPYAEKGESVSQRVIWQRVKSRPPRPLHELAPDAPAELTAIVEKAMARDASDRYPDMKALAADLQAYLDVKVVSAYETGAIAELKKWVQRNPALSAAAAALVLVLAGATTIVTRQKNLVEARKAEFELLAGKTYLELALEREKDLYPPWPAKIEAMERWLAEDAKRLLDMKPTLESKLADLRARALPQTDEERERDRTTHPKFAEFESLRPRLAWIRTAVSARASGTHPQIPSLPSEFESKTAFELNEFAWKRVRSDLKARVFGEEALALAAARRAISEIEAGDTTSDLAATLDTLAWACFVNCLDAEGRAASARAIEAAPADRKAQYTSFSKSLERAIAEFSGEAGAKLLSDLEGHVAALEKVVNTRHTFTLALESENFLYATLSDLAPSIAALESGAMQDVGRRLQWAKRIGDLTLRHPNARVTWDEARAAIAKADDIVASKLYALSPGGPIDLIPQMGLVPIGMNPVTKLWEFYELRSACDVLAEQDAATLEIPTHRDDGSIDVKDGMGIVFVLLPGGKFLQGAQNVDENAPNYDPRAVSNESLNGVPMPVTLGPFLLSKFEATQTQWLRLAGTNPSAWRSQFQNFTSPTHPIDNISADECVSLCIRFGLSIPTEAQWEYGCRAGTSTVFSFGSSEEEMTRHGNVRDSQYMRLFPNTDPNSCDGFDDGAGVPCRVGRYAGNGFGLFDMHGNVYEWCLDHYGDYRPSAREGDGLRTMGSPSAPVTRGGSYSVRAVFSRSATRYEALSNHRADNLGVRFARKLMPATE
jgi:serine/threonine protein kinase/formylglycine-generating enzyme required for sulfatase activity